MDDGSVFGDLPMCPPDPIFSVKDSYNSDKNPNKVNLGIGGEIYSTILMCPDLPRPFQPTEQRKVSHGFCPLCGQ